MFATDTVEINHYKIKPLNWVQTVDLWAHREWKAVLPVGYAVIVKRAEDPKYDVCTLFIHKGQDIKPTKRVRYPILGTTCLCQTMEIAKKKANKIYMEQLGPFLDLVPEVAPFCQKCGLGPETHGRFYGSCHINPPEPNVTGLGQCSMCPNIRELRNGICNSCFLESRGHT